MLRLTNIRLLSSIASKRTSTLLNAEKVFPDTNNHLQREHLYEMNTKANEKIIFQSANMEADYDLILNFISTYFGVNEPLNRAAGLMSEDAYDIIKGICAETTYTLMAKHEDMIVGMSTVGVSHIPKPQGPEPKRLADYGNEIDNGPLKNRSANQVLSVVHAFELLIPYRLSTPCTAAFGQMTSVHPSYYNKSIAKIMKILIHQIAMKERADYFINLCSAVATATMFANFPGHKLIDAYPYADFYDHGTQPFKNLSDGGTSSAVYAVDLKKYGHLYTIENILGRR